MAKSHVVKLTIKNHTGYKLSDPKPWFDSGRVADGWKFPSDILPGQEGIVEMYEKDWSQTGCSGYVDYTLNGGTVTIAYSNPYWGKNKLGIGTDEKKVWDNMSDHDYGPFSKDFTINSIKFKANMQCSGGDVNNANVNLNLDE